VEQASFSAEVIRFGIFEADIRTGELRKQGMQIKLQEKPFQVLSLLLARPRELVTREELRQKLWSADTFVDFEHGLNKAINKLRKALNDDPKAPRYIETLPRRGYRLIAPVFNPSPATELPGPYPSLGVQPDAMAPQVPLRARWMTRRLIILLGALALLFPSLWYWRAHRRPDTAATTLRSPIRSLAVLPLDNLSGNPAQDYFSDGMTDELITDLAKISSLRVVSRTSVMHYKGSHETVPQMSRELGVDAIVEGSVARSAERVRITVQLVDARKDRDVWAQSFEGSTDDVLSLQDEVATQITAQIEGVLDSAMTKSSHPRQVNRAAYDAYLHGLYFFGRRTGTDALRSVRYFEQSIKLDPSYAQAYAGLAEALDQENLLGVARPDDVEPQIRAAALHALQLDSDLGDAYSVLGEIAIVYDRDWKTAVQDIQRGIELAPNDSNPEINYAVYLAAVGKPKEAVAHAQRALQLDPLSFLANRTLGSMLYFAGDYDEALAQLRRTQELEENPGVIDNWISWIYEEKGMHDEAVREDLKSIAGDGESAANLSYYRRVYARSGWRAYWRARIERLLPKSKMQCVPYGLGVSYLRVGNSREAFRWLDKSADQRCAWDPFIPVDPKLAVVHSDPRFHSLLARMHLDGIVVEPPDSEKQLSLSSKTSVHAPKTMKTDGVRRASE
jgi:TolB-like protein/DNA-binding winged helix-turn-helix (wHTH) protein/Tfp pilus assembly protein PilF